MSEAKRILEMLEDKKITVEEAERLLSALGESEKKEKAKKAHWFKVRVFEGNQQKPKVKIDLPLGLVKVLAKMGMKFSGKIPKSVTEKLQEKGINIDLENIDSLDIDELIKEISSYGPLHIVDIEDGENKVEILIE